MTTRPDRIKARCNTYYMIERIRFNEALIEQETFQGTILPNIILKAMLTSRRFLELRDFGNREKTVIDQEYGEIERFMGEYENDSFTFDNGVFSDYRRNLIKKY